MAALAVAADVEALLLRPLDLSEAGYAPTLLAQASAAVRRWTRQTLDRVTADTVTLRPDGSDLLPLPQLPIVAVTTVTVSGQVQNPSSYDVVHGGLRRWGGWWPYRDVTVTYDHGFLPVPPDIAAVVADLVAARVRSAATNPGAVLKEDIGSYKVQFGPVPHGLSTVVLSADHKAVLQQYRRSVGSVELTRAREAGVNEPGSTLDAFTRSVGG